MHALVVFAYGRGFVLIHDTDEATSQFISDCGGGDTFDLEDVGADYETPPKSGVYTGTLSIEDDGPGDWPGSREGVITVKDWRPATEEEWAAFRAGDWPWEDS